jgi:hypothetical protein
VGILGLGPVVRHLCQRADRLKVREAVSLWDGGPRTVLLAAFRAQRACFAVHGYGVTVAQSLLEEPDGDVI